MEAVNASQLANAVLSKMNSDLSRTFDADVIFMKSPIKAPLDRLFRIEVETIRALKPKRGRTAAGGNLVILLETVVGYIETVKRIVDVMRRNYRTVSFVIPDHAYSAGTVLALAGDEIYMDYYSILGPIDPQMPDESGGTLLPGAGYLAKFQELAAEINSARLDDPKAKQAELNYLIKRFEPAKLYHIEQAIEHSQTLIEEWLPKYKFKSWTTTSTGIRVTPTMRRQRAKDVAKVLGDSSKWHSHGRGISMQELEHEDIKLQIKDFGKDAALSELIRNYHGLAVDFAAKQGIQAFIHSSRNGMRSV